MKIYIFKDVNKLTNNYHSGGGLVIIAENKDDCLEIIKNKKEININKKEWSKCISYELKGKYKKEYYIFPDAGCCG